MSNTTTTAAPHKWSNLFGPGPYRYIGMRENRFVACPGATARPGSTCDVCGTAIVSTYYFRAPSGQEFHVGCECVRWSGDAGLVDTVKRAARDADRKSRAAREKESAEWARGMLASDDVRETLSGMPHPKGWADRSRLDWAEWMMRNAGAKGRGQVVKFLRTLGAEAVRS